MGSTWGAFARERPAGQGGVALAYLIRIQACSTPYDAGAALRIRSRRRSVHNRGKSTDCGYREHLSRVSNRRQPAKLRFFDGGFLRLNQADQSCKNRLTMLFNYFNRTDKRRYYEITRGKHYFRPLSGRSRAIANIVYCSFITRINVAYLTNVIIRHDPKRVTQRRYSVSNCLMILRFVKMIVKLSTLKIIRRIKINERINWPIALSICEKVYGV